MKGHILTKGHVINPQRLDTSYKNTPSYHMALYHLISYICPYGL